MATLHRAGEAPGNAFRLEGELNIFHGARLRDELLALLAEHADLELDLADVVDCDSCGIQLLLREVQSDSLIIALKGASEEMREKIFKNMSQRAAEMMREDLESKGPVRLSEVEAEQKEILKIVRRLAEEGQVMMASKGGDDGFV